MFICRTKSLFFATNTVKTVCEGKKTVTVLVSSLVCDLLRVITTLVWQDAADRGSDDRILSEIDPHHHQAFLFPPSSLLHHEENKTALITKETTPPPAPVTFRTKNRNRSITGYRILSISISRLGSVGQQRRHTKNQQQ